MRKILPSDSAYYFRLIILFISVLITNQFVYSQPVTQEWVRRYDSPEHLSEGGIGKD